MSIANHYLQVADQLITNYNGSSPFALVLKQFFSTQKKYGSRDRKAIASLCYAFFRVGKAWSHLPAAEKIRHAYFLCHQNPMPVLAPLSGDHAAHYHQPLAYKRSLVPALLDTDIFPWLNLLSAGIDPERFAFNHLQQPYLYLRVRPGQLPLVLQALQSFAMSAFLVEDDSIALPNGSPVDDVLELNKVAVVQDYSSAAVGRAVAAFFNSWGFTPSNMWDCCAASGGKSIMFHDLYPLVSITVSDVRPAILKNLEHRFALAGISKYRCFVANLENEGSNVPASKFDFVVADVPCTGSGTWARTPEQLYSFSEKGLPKFSKKQLAIALKASQQLAVGGYLLYITCSVFRAENEDVVRELAAGANLQLLHQTLLGGIQHRADSMFFAILKRT